MNNIAAIATGLSAAGISIIRISGETSISEVNKIFKGQDLTTVKPNTLNYGHIVDGDQVIDEVLVGIMHNPRSFTGEDVVEINCHGGMLITERILKLVLTLDVEVAEPGEFSKRAFLNGKKSLSEVSQTMELIEAKNETALNLAINTFSNPTNKLVEGLRSKLMDIISVIEVSIDYPEYDDIEEMTNEKLLPKIDLFQSEISAIIEDSKRGALFKNGIDVAIVGSPNVGKSSLLNYMSRENRAIVTDIAGTTRDVVETEINMKGLTLNLLDTAGIRETEDVVEKIGVEKSREQIELAKLVLFVVDSSRQLTPEEIELYELVSNKNHIVILNKTDLELQVDTTHFENFISLSALNQSGIENLEHKILEVLDLDNFDSQNAKYINRIQDVQKLEKTKMLLDEVREQIEFGMPVDTVEIDLKDALFSLGEILGIEVKNDLLNELFSRFCLGK
ncbi:tRNA uridine-5-carboxymethylaminomethyl(34) synthesis GTPase MnmE [Mollicutes bacterium LVI A0078]|nr:tRNA uridine-5-carboxymethylaminomethyl(34) synthesis GTPase MnmE [Mollicutes bacterium LVI A0075]WOO91079.1 tRNA uridine-5-carboxymethylaminomethyl(34) synthesis GTPase MnmE [Mollicutes bacterium LVI A0078]